VERDRLRGDVPALERRRRYPPTHHHRHPPTATPTRRDVINLASRAVPPINEPKPWRSTQKATPYFIANDTVNGLPNGLSLVQVRLEEPLQLHPLAEGIPAGLSQPMGMVSIQHRFDHVA
jgi:hypothetical protein